MMETGQLMSADVMPKLTKRMSEFARENDALGKAMKSVNAEQGRFETALTGAKEALFKGGMGEGMATVFRELANSLTVMKPLFKFIGSIMSGALKAIAGALDIVMRPLELFSVAIKDMDMSNLGHIIGAGGTLLLLASRFTLIYNMVMKTNIALLTMLRRLAAITVPALAIEDLVRSQLGMSSLTGRVTDAIGIDVESITGVHGIMMNISESIGKVVQGIFSDEPTKVNITVNTEGVEKLVDVKLNTASQTERATIMTRLGG